MRKPVRLITFAAAVIAGAVLALVIIPAWNRHRALAAIAHDDPAVRQRGWDWLCTAEGDDGGIRAERLIEDIGDRLASASDEALLHGGLVMRQAGLWRWAHQDDDLLLREIGLRAGQTDPMEHAMALELLAVCPLDRSPDALLPVFNALLAADDAQIRRGALGAACGFAGRDRPEFIIALEFPTDDDRLHRLRHLALTWVRPPAAPPRLDDDAPIDVLEAMLLRAILADPEDASPVLPLLDAWPAEDRPAFEYILRYSVDPAAVRILERLAEADNLAARYALHARARRIDEAQARSVADDPSQPINIRRMAAWRWDRVPANIVENLLSAEVASPDGGVYAAALLAERRLPREEAIALAETWIRSFDDDEKRAGALLAALLDAHGDLLARAHEIEDIGRVRTTQRLALWAIGRTAGEEDPPALAHRALHAGGGDFDADVALCMLLAGRVETFELLTSRPTGDAGPAVQKRAWLIERFAPTWHEAVGRPIGGSRRAIHLHFDRLEALRMLTHRRLHHDRASRTYTETASTSSGASSQEDDNAG